MLSIIIPVYNSEKYLSDCISSVLAQSYSYWQLVCVDASDEEHRYVGETVLSYGEDRITYRKLPENKGISGNTN
ncbi:MAG: glycosyltransferase, partial [Treponema sp.]|nr:glycosyltransferase [Treponema sp.]